MPAVIEPQLPSVAGGRYTASKFLGEGGRKRVFLAQDSLLERDVALAIIKTEGLDEPSAERVRRESRSMAKLGDHPNVVTIFDVGEEAGGLYLISEYMPGGSVEDLLVNSANRGLAVPEVIRIGSQVSAALGHAHERGIIHRDLKPANIWLTADGTAKLGDFGLAAVAQSSKITTEGMMVGTVAYMSPEQATGKPFDVRTDLYSLGAMLYEMATGRPPFAGDDVVAVISQHLNTAPVSPSWHNSEIPPALEDLILRLLAKGPDDRPASATEVRDLLGKLSTHASLTEQRVELAEVNPLDRLASGIFVGREDETQQLRRMFDSASAGSGGMGFLVGEPGIGKTRTSEELMTYARLKGAQVLVGRCYEGEGAPAYWPWIQAIRAYVHDRPPEVLVSDMGSGAGHIAQIVSDVRDLVPNVEEPVAADPEVARFQLFDSIATFLRHVARRRPLTVLLDDLHWADKPSLLLLEFLAKQLHDSRLFVLGTYRDVELGRQHPLAQTLAGVIREPNVSRILLRGLDEADVARYIELSAGIEPSPALVRAIFRETEGNPFFMSETVRLLASEKRLESDSGQWSVTIPQGVKEVIGRRLDQLTPACNEMLTLASVVGREFDLAVLEMLGEFQGDALVDAIEESLAARVVLEVPGPTIKYRFAHALIRETLYEELSSTKRIRLHRSAGEVIEKLSADDPERHITEMAYHFFEAAPLGEVDKAVQYARQAGDRATRLLAYEEAAVQYDRALQALELKDTPDDVARCNLLLELGKSQTRAGAAEHARTTFGRATECARRIGSGELLAQAALGSGEVWVEAGYVNKDLIGLLNEAIEALGDQDSALKVRVLARAAEANKFDPDTKQLEIDLSNAAVEMGRRVGDDAALAQALYSKLLSLGGAQDAALSEEIATELIRSAERAGDIQQRLLGHRIRVTARFELGNIGGAKSDADVYARLAEEAKLPLYFWFAHLHRATWSFAEGRLQEADELVRRAVAEGVKAGDQNAHRFSIGAVLTVEFEKMESEFLQSIAPMVVEMSSVFPWLVGLSVFVDHALGDTESARAKMLDLLTDDFKKAFDDWGWVWMLGLLTEVARATNDAASAKRIYPALEPFANFYGIPGLAYATNGIGHHHLGVLATTYGDYDAAESHLEEALSAHSRAGFAYFTAQTHLAQAELCATRSGPGDVQRGLRLAGQVADVATQLSLPRTLQRAVDLRVSLQGLSATDVSRSIHVIASEVAKEQPSLAEHASPDGTVTILFTDIESSTELNERLGDQVWLEILAAHDEVVRAEVAKAGGVVVKSRGDGFMVAFPSARQALRSAIEIQKALSDREPVAQVPIKVRIGIHTGEVLQQSGDYFGRHVNFASRIADKAAGDEILVSELTRALVAGSPEFTFGDLRTAPLKGFPGEHAMSSLNWS
ncbi:MAG TPA: protein kinase [Actinomycetota bacterium]|nr:protein kinase [Actinomycetota bacterium]